MRKRSLPPKVINAPLEEITWKQLRKIDFDSLGYLLSCHLIIEHYIEELLKTRSTNLDWEAAKLTFAQKIQLLSKFDIKDPYNFIPAFKALNKLRNKLSHQVDYNISSTDLLPFRNFIVAVDRAQEAEKRRGRLPYSTKGILESFTSTSCAYIAGWISSHKSFQLKLIKAKVPPRATT